MIVMRCFTDSELRQGIVAVRLAHPEADLFAVFLLATEVVIPPTDDDEDHPRSDRVDNPDTVTTQRGDG